MLDDVTDFKQTDKAMSNLGMSDAEKLDIYSAVAAILHLGNITFEDNVEDAKGGCQMTKSSHQALRTASTLIGVDPEELHHALLSRVMQPSKGGIKGTVIMVPLKVCFLKSRHNCISLLPVNDPLLPLIRFTKLATLAMLWQRQFTAASLITSFIGSIKVFPSSHRCTTSEYWILPDSSISPSTALNNSASTTAMKNSNSFLTSAF